MIPKPEMIKKLLSTDAGRRLAASMVQPHRPPVVECPVCGRETRDLVLHAKSWLDPEHRVLSVMAS